MGADPEGLRRLADTLRLQADALRLTALRARAAAAVRWRSPAAELFRAQLEDRAQALDGASEDTRALARDLDALAVRVVEEAAGGGIRGGP
jgi:hypothetical protein